MLHEASETAFSGCGESQKVFTLLRIQLDGAKK